MNADQARDLFSDALDKRFADDATARAFEQALAADPALAAEYQAFAEFSASLQQGASQPEAPDLLPNVQRKLRARSRGKFYRDAFSQRANLSAQPWLFMLLALLLLGVVCAYFALSATVLP